MTVPQLIDHTDRESSTQLLRATPYRFLDGSAGRLRDDHPGAIRIVVATPCIRMSEDRKNVVYVPPAVNVDPNATRPRLRQMDLEVPVEVLGPEMLPLVPVDEGSPYRFMSMGEDDSPERGEYDDESSSADDDSSSGETAGTLRAAPSTARHPGGRVDARRRPRDS